MRIERCNRCCSDEHEFLPDDKIGCKKCGTTEPFEVWQLFGWRDIKKYPPVHSGTIFVYGQKVGRIAAKWDKEAKTIICDGNPDDITHWLRTPDPRKQINMK